MNDFIEICFLRDKEICEELIDYFEKSPHKKPGVSTSGNVTIDKSIKDSTDLSISLYDSKVPQCIINYVNQLQEVCEKYIKKYPYCNEYSKWAIVEEINIQHYNPNGGFKVFHTERCSANSKMANRHLAFMTYLNDVNDKGQTEFLHQKRKIRPEKGKTLIWPCDWTHTHRGIPSERENKYIITGWYSFY
jgi:hypothetical protein